MVVGGRLDAGMEAVDINAVYWDLGQQRQNLERFAASLCPEENARASRLVPPMHREQFILAHGLLRQTLAAALGQAPETLRFGRGVHGKPALVEDAAGGQRLEFSLSRSEDGLLIATAVGTPIGCDLEQVRTIAQARTMMTQWFTQREHDAIERLSGGDFDRAFLSCWVRKEAMLKAVGVGLQRSLHFETGFTGVDGQSASAVVDGRRLWVTNLSPASGWVGAVASERSLAVRLAGGR